MSGMTTLEKIANAAMLRQRIERSISDSDACCLRAKFGPSDHKTTQLAICTAAIHIWDFLAKVRTCRVNRSAEYVTRVLHYTTCVRQRDREGEWRKIVEKYGVSGRTFFRDFGDVNAYLKIRVEVMIDRLSKLYQKTDLIP